LVLYIVYDATHRRNIKILAQDSIVYFVGITGVLVCSLVYTRNHILLGTALTMPASVLACIAAARLSMNIRSLSMDIALSTLAYQSRFLPTLLFRGPESVSYGTGEDALSNHVIEPWLEEMTQPEDDEDNQHQDQLLEPKESSSIFPARTIPNCIEQPN